MSRVAEALRRHRNLTLGMSGGSNVDAAAAASSWFTTEVPWELEDAAPSTAPPKRAQTPPPSRDVTADAIKAPAAPHPALGRAPHEQLSRLVHRMLQSAPSEARVRSVLFTSLGSETSHPLCAATADALTRHTAASICVVEANLHNAAGHASLAPSGAPGISDVLRQEADLRACLARVGSNLWVVPAGLRRDHDVPTVLGEQMRGHLRELLGTFDYVLVDTATASAHSDAAALARLVDGVVLVIGANSTRREAARRVVDELRAAEANVLGALLTNRDFPIPEKIYRLL